MRYLQKKKYKKINNKKKRQVYFQKIYYQFFVWVYGFDIGGLVLLIGVIRDDVEECCVFGCCVFDCGVDGLDLVMFEQMFVWDELVFCYDFCYVEFCYVDFLLWLVVEVLSESNEIYLVILGIFLVIFIELIVFQWNFGVFLKYMLFL